MINGKQLPPEAEKELEKANIAGSEHREDAFSMRFNRIRTISDYLAMLALATDLELPSKMFEAIIFLDQEVRDTEAEQDRMFEIKDRYMDGGVQ